LITFKKSFLGEECITWMLKNLPLRNREEGVKLGQKLMDNQFILHASKSSKPFKDGNSFYVFSVSNSHQSVLLIVLQEHENFHTIKAKITSLRDEPVVVSASDFEPLKVLGEGEYGKVTAVSTIKYWLMQFLGSVGKKKRQQAVVCNEGIG
jgi:hypothetical protein